MDTRLIAVWVLLLALVLLLASSADFTRRDAAILSGFAAISAAWLFVISQQLDQSSLRNDWLTAPIWRQTSSILGEKIIGSISVARHQPFFSAGSQIACFLAMLCGYLIGRNRRLAHVVTMTFLGSALLYAVYGLAALSFWPNYLLWHQKFNYLNSLTSTYVNPNVAASYFGAAAIGWILLFVHLHRDRAAPQAPLPWPEMMRLHLHASRREMSCLLACFAIFAALLMTGSRAGSVLSLLAIAGALATSLRRRLQQRGLIWIAPALAIIAVGGIIAVFAPLTSQRFAIQGFFDAGRAHAYVSTLQMIGDHPWLGSGLGTFRWNFPAYRSGDIPSYGIWEQAHNTTLEIAAEMGLPFTLLLIAGWGFVLALLARGMLRRKRDQALPTTAFWIGVLVVMHSQVDFPLQVPGFSLAICPILGMGIAQSFSSRA